MKLTTHRTFGWRTSCLHGLVVILGLIGAAAISAQESKPVGEAGKPAEATTGSPKPTPAEPVAAAKMPDIAGRWRYTKHSELGGALDGELQIRRTKADPSVFSAQRVPAFDDPPPAYLLQWRPDLQKFEVVSTDLDIAEESKGLRIETFQLSTNQPSMRQVVGLTEKGVQVARRKGLSQRQIEEMYDPDGIVLTRLGEIEPDSLEEPDPLEEPVAGQRLRANPPNIAGMWHDATDETARYAISPSRNGTGLVIASLRDDQPLKGTVEWIRERGRFEGTVTIPKNFKDAVSLVVNVPSDDGKMRVHFSLSEEQRKGMLKHWHEFDEKHPGREVRSTKELEEALIAAGFQVWVRDSVVFPPASSQDAVSNDPSSDVADVVPLISSRPRRPVSPVPNTPAAKQLVEQLHAQESAAAAEAATIRQLQANGQAEQNKSPIAEHQRKLKHLLSTAFDLKLQWEELQVRELQSRLSRLERQIGQRKELREKIISRRAAELIEGGVLKWTPVASSPNQTVDNSASGDTSATSDAMRSSSTDPSYQEFAKKLGTMNSSVAEAGEALARAERDAGKDVVIDTVPRASRRLEEAIRNRKAIQDEYAAVLRDLELQVESAQAEIDAAKKNADYHTQLLKLGDSTHFESDAAQLRLKQAMLTLERLKVRHDLYKKAGVDISRPSPSQPNSSEERTFDGTPYSQWLKMLETERKPDKSATAMEACARLAATGDERRIARGIFVAAKLFEATDNTKEHNLVWDAGTAALKRLPGEAVVAELLAALHDEQFKDAREFPCRFLIAVAGSPKSSVSDSLKAAFKRHDQELVTTLLEARGWTMETRGRVHEFQNSPISSSPLPKSVAANSEIRTPDPSSRNSRLLAGAASVWLISERKLSEFDGLRPLVMQAIDEVYSRTTGRIDRREQPWFSVSSRLVATEPETPGLAILLAKHINQDRTQIAGRLSDMGAHAEPAVPLLIEDFLVHWKNRETDLRHSAANTSDGARANFEQRGQRRS